MAATTPEISLIDPAMEVLSLAVDKALERARLLRENKAYQENLEELVRQRTAEVEDTRLQIMKLVVVVLEVRADVVGALQNALVADRKSVV